MTQFDVKLATLNMRMLVKTDDVMQDLEVKMIFGCTDPTTWYLHVPNTAAGIHVRLFKIFQPFQGRGWEADSQRQYFKRFRVSLNARKGIELLSCM